MTIDATTERVFSQAVALAQQGRMKSSIHVGFHEVYILNMDNTILIQNKILQEFDLPFSFYANDYESKHLRLDRENHVIFLSNSGGYKRKKTVPAPKMDFGQISRDWMGYPDIKKDYSITLSDSAISLLDDNLSHVEFHKIESDSIVMVQKDIYSGARIEIQELSSGFKIELGNQNFELNPIGIRTVDLKALYLFDSTYTFYFQPGQNYVYLEGSGGNIKVILATCLYDEISYLAKVKGDK